MVSQATRASATTAGATGSARRWRSATAIDATAYRLVHGEADGLPSLIVDRYADFLVIQTLSQGMERHLPAIVAVLVDLAGAPGHPRAERPAGARARGPGADIEVLHGEVPDFIEVREGPVPTSRSSARAEDGPLPGPAREPRGDGPYARGRVLDGFTYHGGFALDAARCDSVLAPDVSEDAVAHIRPTPRGTGCRRQGARRERLRRAALLRPVGERFDTIVLDPPAFAKNKARSKRRCGLQGDQPPRAADAEARRILITCRCSYNVHEPLFRGPGAGRGRRARERHDPREADAGPRPPGAAGRAGDVLPEVRDSPEGLDPRHNHVHNHDVAHDQ